MRYRRITVGDSETPETEADQVAFARHYSPSWYRVAVPVTNVLDEDGGAVRIENASLGQDGVEKFENPRSRQVRISLVLRATWPTFHRITAHRSDRRGILDLRHDAVDPGTQTGPSRQKT